MEDEADRIWCYFRCLVQACYREARHIGTSADPDAKCVVTAAFSETAISCRANRGKLKGLTLWSQTAQAKTTAEVLAPYVSASGIAPEQLPELFTLPGWFSSFGGARWARIAEVMIDLRSAMEIGNVEHAHMLCEVVQGLHHNSGPLVPVSERWRTDPWQREKWPELCR